MYRVVVTMRHKDTHRTFRSYVSVEAPYGADAEACLVAAQLAATHRESWMPIKTQILSLEA